MVGRARGLIERARRRVRSRPQPVAGDGPAVVSQPDQSDQPEQAEPAAPLVSVIVPVFDVEDYVGDCLASILRQEGVSMEVIVVDDGSTDSSPHIVRSIADADTRVRVVRQHNQGLGAARNTGVRHARGAYLCFVDSDDLVPRGALADMVASAEGNGADVVVGAPARLHDGRRRPVGWTHIVHRCVRNGTTLAEFPALLRNNYTWGKLYRRSFWDHVGEWFREGVAYEDQPLVTTVLSRARVINVLTRVVYLWRFRGDGSSISQQVHSVRDLRDRAQALRLTKETHGGAPYFRNWLVLAIDAQLRWYLLSDALTDDDYWRELHGICRELLDDASDEPLRGVDPALRVQFVLVRDGKRDHAIEYQRRKGHHWTQCEVEQRPDGLLMGLPFLRDGAAGVSDEHYLLDRDTIRISHRISRLAWEGVRLVVEGRAYLRLVHLDDPAANRIELLLVSGDDELAAIATTACDVSVTPTEDDLAAPYDWGGFRAEIDPATLMEALERAAAPLELHLRVRAAGYEQSVAMSRIPSVQGSTIKWGTHALSVESGNAHEPVRIVARAAVAVIEDATWSDDRLTIAWGAVDPEVGRIQVRAGRAARTVVRDIEPGGTTALAVRRRRRPRSLSVAGPLAGQGTVVLAEGAVSRIDSERGPVELITRPGGTVEILAQPAICEIRRLVLTSDGEGLRLCGRVLDEKATGAVRLALARSGSVAVLSDVVTTGDFDVTLPLMHEPDRHGPRFIPMGTYDLVEICEAVTQRPHVHCDLAARSEIRDRTDRVETTFFPAGREVRITTALRADERGRYHRSRNARAAALLQAETPGVLLTSYFGESATCNGLGVQRALQRRGADLPIFWTVQDFTVPVPGGATPVLRHSREWYRLRATVRYAIDNMYQPIDVDKPPHQVMMQTFHGYPFKTMGLANWRRAKMSREQIESYYRRSAQWDYLVSPATYATPLLREHFGFDGQVLEIGYPRNDVLLTEGAAPVREEVRRRLGVRPQQTVVLYAPTFRDYLSPDDHRAPIIDFLDLEEIQAAFGESLVVLVRGHAFNRRAGSRPTLPPGYHDVTDYPEVNDLILASDAAILDYSSLRFDYGLTGKPMLFHVPDLQRYLDTRGWLLDYPATAPGPRVSTTSEVISALADLGGVASQFADDYLKFREGYLDLDDGHAGDRLVDAVFVPRGDAPAVS